MPARGYFSLGPCKILSYGKIVFLNYKKTNLREEGVEFHIPFGIEVIKALFPENKEQIDLSPEELSYYMTRIAGYGSLKGVEYFISKLGLKGNDDDNFTVKVASLGGHIKIIEYLVENGADLFSKRGPLLDAVIMGKEKTVKYLLRLISKKASFLDISLKSSIFITAIERGNLNILHHIAKHGYYGKNADIKSAFAEACGHGYLNILKYVISLGVENMPTAPCQRNASINSREDVVSFLSLGYKEGNKAVRRFVLSFYSKELIKKI